MLTSVYSDRALLRKPESLCRTDGGDSLLVDESDGRIGVLGFWCVVFFNNAAHVLI